MPLIVTVIVTEIVPITGITLVTVRVIGKGVAKGVYGFKPPEILEKNFFGLTKENKYMHFNFISNTAVV